MGKNEENHNERPKPTRQTPAWLTAFLRWGLVVLVAFALGAVLITLVFQLPLQQKYNEISNELDDAKAEITTLTDQVTQLTTDNETLQQDLADMSLRQAIYKALSDVRAARLAIADDNPAGARLALTQAIQSLDTLATMINKDNMDIVGNMQDKANQANTDLQSGLTTAIPALIQLDGDLVSSLNTLLARP